MNNDKLSIPTHLFGRWIKKGAILAHLYVSQFNRIQRKPKVLFPKQKVGRFCQNDKQSHPSR